MNQRVRPRFDVVGDGPKLVTHIGWRVDGDIAVVGEGQVAALRRDVGADGVQLGVQFRDGRDGLGGELLHRTDHCGVVEHLPGGFGDPAARGIRGG